MRELALLRFPPYIIKVRAKYPPLTSFAEKKDSPIDSLVAVSIVIVGSFRLKVSIFNNERHSPTLYCLSYMSVNIVVATGSLTIDDESSDEHINATDLLITLPPGTV